VVYFLGIVVVAFIHPFLPTGEWLLVHLLLLGAATNAIVVWSSHFAAAVLRTPAPESRRGEALRLAALNAGVIAVLAGGATGLGWLGVTGAAAVFVAVSAHLATLAIQLHRALPSRLRVTVHYYLAAAIALLIGVPVGAVLFVTSTDDGRLLLTHAHVNVLGWVTLTVIGTLVTLWPTTLRTRMAEHAATAAVAGLPPAVAGLAVLAVGLLAWWPVLAVAGLALFAIAATAVLWPGVDAARRRPPHSFATWSIAAAIGWFLAAMVLDGWLLAASATPADAADRLGIVLVPLLVGFVAQVLVGALSYLLPTVLGGGPGPVRERIARLDRHFAQRVVMANLALLVYQLPVGSYVRITTSLLVLAALAQFLVPAIGILVAHRR